MKKKIVRAVALVLVCSMMVLPVSAAEMTEEAVNAVGGEVIELSEEESCLLYTSRLRRDGREADELHVGRI